VRPRRLAVRALAVAALAVAAPAAHAHAFLLRSSPPDACLPVSSLDQSICTHGPLLALAPTRVTLVFSQDVDPVAGGISVLAPDGRLVARGDARAHGRVLSVAVDARTAGSYVVRYRVVAADTHPSRGGYVFSVVHRSRPRLPGGAGTASRAATGLAALGLALHLGGLALLLGAPLFWLLAVPRRAPDAGPPPRLWRLVGAGVALLLLAEPLTLAGESESLVPGHALDPGVVTDVLGSSFGRVLALRLGAAVLVWALVGALRAGGRRGPWAVVAVGGVLVVVDASAAHRLSGVPAALSLAVVAAHVAAMAVWIGGVAAFAWLLRDAPRAERSGAARAFAPLALGGVVLLAASGLALALAHVPSPHDLLASAYGRLVVAKSAVAAAALAIGLLAARRAVARAALVELALLAGVLALAALLVSLPPPR
jgi:copper transport protein